MASDVEFQHGREMNILELLCHLVKRISFLAKLVCLTLQNVESVFDVIFTSSKASSSGKSFSELRFDDILIQVSQTKRQVPKSFFFPRSPRYFFYSQNQFSWKFMGVSISSCINYLENVN